MFPKKIVIVGGGFSGTALTIQLIKNSVTPLKITLIEKSDLARGVAYLNDNFGFKLNVRANQMGLYPDSVTDFYDWLKIKNFNISPTDFVERKIYGDYLKEKLSEAIKTSTKVEVEILQDEAVEIIYRTKEIFLASKKNIGFDFLVLATGFNVSSYQALLKLKPSSEAVTILGSGLTAIDALIYLQKINYTGKIFLASRHGLLPKIHKSLKAQPNSKIDSTEKFTIPLLALLEKIKTLLKEHDWYTIIDTLRPKVKLIWNNFSDHEKSQFVRYLKPYWEVHRHRISEEHSLLINDLIKQQRLEIKKIGYKKFIPTTKNLLNCKGLSVFELAKNPLIKSLLDKNILTIDKHALGFMCDDDGKVNSDFIYILGPIRRAHFFECTAVPEIRQHAHDLAVKLLKF